MQGGNQEGMEACVTGVVGDQGKTVTRVVRDGSWASAVKARAKRLNLIHRAIGSRKRDSKKGRWWLWPQMTDKEDYFSNSILDWV